MWGWDSWGPPQQSQFFIGLLGNSVAHYCVRQKKNVTLAVKCCIYQFPGFLGKQCTVCQYLFVENSWMAIENFALLILLQSLFSFKSENPLKFHFGNTVMDSF